MRSLKTIIGVTCALLAIAFLVVGQRATFSGLSGARLFIASFTNRGFSYEELVRVRTENEALRSERAVLLGAGITPFSAELIKAPLYSRYPYGTGGLLTIAAGEEQGVREGMPVLAAPGTLLGKVTRVERTRSEVTTIFNASWRSSVRFEGTAARALLTGGEKPSLTLIPRGKEPVLHAKVVNVDPSFPYGLFLGTAGEIVEEEESPWRAAPLELTYQEFALAEVLIVVNFE